MPAYSSDHPEVIAFWTGPMQAAADNWRRVANEVEDSTGRKIYTTESSMGDGYPVGLSLKDDEMQPPQGWRWYQGAKNQIICPRAKGPGSKEGHQIMMALNKAYPTPRKELQDRFGVPAFLWFGLRVATPGISLWDGTLWVYYGERPDDMGSKEWDGGEHFTLRKLSEYHAAHEDAEEAEARDVQPAE